MSHQLRVLAAWPTAIVQIQIHCLPANSATVEHNHGIYGVCRQGGNDKGTKYRKCSLKEPPQPRCRLDPSVANWHLPYSVHVMSWPAPVLPYQEACVVEESSVVMGAKQANSREGLGHVLHVIYVPCRMRGHNIIYSVPWAHT